MAMMIMVVYKMAKVESTAVMIEKALETLHDDFKRHMERFHERE